MTLTRWQYLEKRPHPWRQQLYLKGKRIKANVIYSDMIVNKETPEEAAENWDLPLAAIDDRSKDMSRQAIVKAIANLETANIPLANQFISLNQWNY